MPTNNISPSNRTPRILDSNRMDGGILVPSTYIGIVRNNVDPTRSGRLQVWIPEFGGSKPDISANWITVSYANPFMGASRMNKDFGPGPTRNSFRTVSHSYGMWFVPPDLGNYVLVTFIAGDLNRGYWFACIMPEIGHYAIPGLAGSTPEVGSAEMDDSTLASCLTNPPYPSVEFNEDNEELKKYWDNFLQIAKPIHEAQAKVLLRQGLEDDKTRGVITSSSERESPSRVFGISTPGRPSPEKNPNTGAPVYRMGGHTFVMDDGDSQEADQLIRLRTAGGHQILMNDSEEVLYIANSNGSVWMEFDGEGQMHVFSNSNINIRTKKDFNLHADGNINMFAGSNIKMASGSSIQAQSTLITGKASEEMNLFGQKVGISSGSTLGLQAATQGSFGSGTELVYSSGMIYLNTQAAPTITAPANIPKKTYVDTVQTKPDPYYKWKASGSVSSITSYPVPTHEPWEYEHPTAATQKTGSSGTQPATSTTTSTTSKPTTGDSAGPAAAQGKGVSRPASAADLSAQPANTTGIGSLTAEQTTALKAQLGKSESNGNYSAENQLGYIGKYQFGAAALIDQGYVKAGTTNRGLSNPANWTGKDGITSKEVFWASHDVQESIMDTNLSRNYKTLTKLGTINSSSTADDVAGKLSVAHLLGAGGCNKWSKGLGGSDANGTTGDTYYNRGRYAITVLSKTSSDGTTA